MKRSLKDLTGYETKAEDGIKGKVKDFLFDEDKWIIRYTEVDLGHLFSDKRVIIPRAFLKEPMWSQQLIPVGLSKKDIENCPDLDEKLPVSRKYEEELSKHYQIESYWTGIQTSYTPMSGTPVMAYPPRPVRVPKTEVNEHDLDTNLRSFKEIKDYHINVLDGTVGHVDDLIFDDIDWQIKYAVIDTNNWLPWSKKVMLRIDWMKSISYVDEEIIVDIEKEQLKSAPEYNDANPVTDSIEEEVNAYFSELSIEK